ncbi:MAG TPA: hypothetical protein VG265_15455 [Gaiellaceae bacterium]|nr:hypothetical protein [Gaiellaceae bacterium]
MASQLYPQGAAHILGKSTKVDLIGDNVKILFYSSTFSSAHEFVSDLTGASIIARSGNLAGKTSTNGVFDANDITVTAVSGSAFTHVILYKDTGTDSTSPLVAIFDVTSFTPTGADVNVVFNASGLLSIA